MLVMLERRGRLVWNGIVGSRVRLRLVVSEGKVMLLGISALIGVWGGIKGRN